MAFMILLFLPSFPFSSSFLTPREKAIAQARLNRDHRPQSHGGMTGWEGFKAIVNDVHGWALMIVYASCESPPQRVSVLVLNACVHFGSQRRRSDHLVLPAHGTQPSSHMPSHLLH